MTEADEPDEDDIQTIEPERDTGTEGDENSLPEETTTVFPEEEDPSTD